MVVFADDEDVWCSARGRHPRRLYRSVHGPKYVYSVGRKADTFSHLNL